MHRLVRISRRCRYLVISIVLLANTLVVLAPKTVAAVSAGSIISLTNTQRAANGLPALTYSGALSSSAYAKAMDMVAKDYWAHTSPDGLTPWTFIARAGYAYTAAGENLAKGFTGDSEVVSAWMASPAHRANILSSAYRDIGVAVVSGTISSEQTTIIVAHYGATAAPAAPVPKPVAKPATTVAKQVATQPVAHEPAPQTPTQPIEQPAPKPAPEPPKPKPGEVFWRILWPERSALECQGQFLCEKRTGL